MSEFGNLLLPLDASPAPARAVETALWLAESLDATLHVLHATSQPRPPAEALAHLLVQNGSRARLVVHQPAGDPRAAALDAVERYGIDLVVMSTRGQSLALQADAARPLGGVARAVLERTRVPVLLLPPRRQRELPWRSMLVAASGEAAADDALATAVRLAAALRLHVTVLHIDTADSRRTVPPMSGYADELHHEVPGRMQDLVSRGLIRCTAEQARCISEVELRSGDVASTILEEARRSASGVVALGWHGVLDEGRALVLKQLLEDSAFPLLVVRRPQRPPRARLNVGVLSGDA